MMAAIVVAGGSGLRMGARVRKQYLRLEDRPILAHTLVAIDACDALDHIVLVVPEDDFAWCRRQILADLHLDHDIRLVAGGQCRQHSVVNGLAAVDADDGIVMIHDGVRPFVSRCTMERLLVGVRGTGACIPALQATDTLKRVADSGVITATLDRQRIYMAQTPQAFSLRLIRDAHRQAGRAGFKATDDASVVEFAGGSVTVIPGERENIKITTPMDLVIARAILRDRSVGGEPP